MFPILLLAALATTPINYQVEDAFTKILILNKKIDPIRAERIADYVITSTKIHNLEPNLVLALIYTESYFDEEAIGTSGEFGLMQVMPFWAKDKLCRGMFLYRTRDNVECGSRILSYYAGRFDGSTPLGLSAYNRGETAVRRLIKRGKSPIHWYVKRILGHKKDLDKIDFILGAIRDGKEKKETEEEVTRLRGASSRELHPRL